MRNPALLLLAVLTHTPLAPPTDNAPPQPAAEVRMLTPAAVADDVRILRTAMESVHPGLYRYTSKAELDRAFDELSQNAGGGISEADLFRRVSQVAVLVHCGHTFCNLMNQDDGLIARVFDGRTFLPFYFRIVGGRMVVTHNLTDERAADTGAEVVSIDGHPVAEILGRLLTISKSDGLNTISHRRSALEVRRAPAEAKYVVNLFDVYYPIFFPPGAGRFRVVVRDVTTGAESGFVTPALTRRQRLDAAEAKYGPLPPPESSWAFSRERGGIAHLKIGTFFTFGWKLDPARFLADAFAEMRRAGCTDLIVDLRGNVGGLTQYSQELKRYVANRPIPDRDGSRFVVRALKLSPSLSPYLKTYEDWMSKALGGGLPEGDYRRLADGRFEYVKGPPAGTIEPYPDHFRGNIYFISDSSNASAASEFLGDIRRDRLGTIVGQATGGNLQGINGGVFFLRLPNSKIEMDLPFGCHVPEAIGRDGGIEPDYRVEPSVEEASRGIDAELSFVEERLIKKKPR